MALVDALPNPTAFEALTLATYLWPSFSPVTEHFVAPAVWHVVFPTDAV